jgi:hypothetical protein
MMTMESNLERGASQESPPKTPSKPALKNPIMNQSLKQFVPRLFPFRLCGLLLLVCSLTMVLHAAAGLGLAPATPDQSSFRILSLAPGEAPPAKNTGLSDKPKRNVEGIMDNAFLIEEAYNQEAGVVQHILTGFYNVNRVNGPDDKAFDLSFTQEWPLWSQTHQLSYTVPYSFLRSGGQNSDGVGDVLLNYRYQAYFNEDTLTAFAPRVSLVLPTGDAARGFGDNAWGYQANLPYSMTLGDEWFAHANAGLTFLPNAGTAARKDLLHYNVGASAIYAATPDLHFMLEWVGYWDQLPAGSGRDRQFSTLISPGLRKAFNFDNGSQLVLGLATPIGLNGPAPDFGVFLYVSFEHFLKKQKSE